jgi:hypothetical protein
MHKIEEITSVDKLYKLLDKNNDYIRSLKRELEAAESRRGAINKRIEELKS